MQPRDTGTAYLLWCAGLLGINGLHRFDSDKPFTGLLWLATGGLCLVGQFVDLLLIPGQVAVANTRLALAGRSPMPELPPRRRVSRKDHMRILLCRAAAEKGGAITVTDGVMATGQDHVAVEKALDEMARRRWVEIANELDSGVVIYRFTDFG